MSTRSLTVQPDYIGPSIVTPAGDLYVANSLVGATSPTQTFGDPSNGRSEVSKVGASTGYAIQLGGVYYIRVMALDAAGSVLVGGYAPTTGLPITTGAYRITAPGDHAPFVCKLRAADGAPVFCTYLDSTQIDLAAMSTDSSLNVYILAKVRSTGSVPASAGALSLGDQQIMLMKLDGAGSMKFIAEFGGSRGEAPQFLAIDSSGDAYIAGTTVSPDFPGTAGSAFPTLPPPALGTSSFVAKVDPAGANILWASYGRAYDIGTALTVDGSGQVYLAGLLNGLFVRKFSADGSTISWERNLGNAGASAIAIDSLGTIAILGGTQSINFQVHNSTSMCPVQDQPNRVTFTGGSLLFRLSPAGGLLQSTFLSTRGGIESMALSLSSLTGYAASVDYGATSLTVSQVGADVGGHFATALGCVGSAATPVNSNPPAALAPGEIISIFGEGLGPAASSVWTLTPDDRIASSLAGVQVTFDGVPAPLLYVQSSQINAITPWSLAGRTTSHLCVNYSGKSSCADVSIFAAVPTIFTSATSYGAAVNQDGTLNTPQNPAPVGSIISLFLTGLGPLNPLPADGAITSWPAPSLAYSTQVWFPYPDFHMPLSIAGEVLYAGAAPLEVGGLYQINVRIPGAKAPGYGTVSALWVTVALPDGTHSISSDSVFVATQ